MPLFNFEVSLSLTWSENCAITSMEKRVIINTRRDVSPTGATFKITDTNCMFQLLLCQQKMIINF